MSLCNYIIVDDEPIAHEIIKGFAQNIKYLSLQGDAFNALQANQLLMEKKVDLMFLDIEMPKLKGLDFLRTLIHPPKVIVTTAYQEYALEGFELNVIDYLLKPFSFSRFLQAINKFPASKERPSKDQLPSKTEETIFLKSNKKVQQVRLDKIKYLESMGSYVKFHLESDMIMVHESLQHFDASLPLDMFVRVHKSFIISMSWLSSIEGNSLFLGDSRIPIGRSYRINLMKRIKLG